jgi:hypothetical protein
VDKSVDGSGAKGFDKGTAEVAALVGAAQGCGAKSREDNVAALNGRCHLLRIEEIAADDTEA